jgi:hypothetical protein
MHADSIEAACQRLSLAFAVHVDAHAFVELGQLFAEDGVLRRASGDLVTGPEAITRSFDDRLPSFTSVHMLAPSLIEIVSDTEATGRCAMMVVVQETPDSPSRRIGGQYEDRYRRIDGAWKFAARLLTVTIQNG